MPTDQIDNRRLSHACIDLLEWRENEARIRGWIFHPDVALECVDIGLAVRPWLSSVPLRERPDVMVHYTPTLGHRPHLAQSGFDVTGPIPSGIVTPSQVTISLLPHREDGSALDPFITYAGGESVDLLPPVHLQDRVGGSTNFLAVAQQLTSLLLTSIVKWTPFSEAQTILDWGCGCGRVIAQLMTFLPAERLYGCDIDAEAIAWDRENLIGPFFDRIEPYPPTAYSDEQFDIVYGISVMTHLEEETQHAWLNELRRITRPGGVLALSVIGSDLRATRMPPDLAATFARTGFATFVPSYSNLLGDSSPSGYYQEAYHSLEYIREVWSRYFEVLEYLPTGHQDIVLLRKR